MMTYAILATAVLLALAAICLVLGMKCDRAQRVANQHREQRDCAAETRDVLRRQLDELANARNVALRIHEKRMPQGEVKRAFAVADDAPLWIALNQEIDDYLQDVMDQVSLPPGQTMSEETRTHVAGGVEHIRLLQKRLLEVHAAAQKVDTDLETEEQQPATTR